MAVEEKVAYRWPMLSYLFLINLIVNGFVLMIMPPLFPQIEVDFALSYAQIGLIWGALPLGMLFFSLIGGVAADRFGVKKVIVIALIFTAILGGLRGFAFNFWSLWLPMLLMGVSYGFVTPNLAKGVAMWFGPSELSRANGILLMGPFIGGGLALIVAAPLAAALGGWQNVMFLGGGLAIASWILWLVAAREREPTGAMAEQMRARPPMLKGLRQVFSVRDIWLLGVVEMFVIGNLLAVVAIVPTFLVEKGMSETEAGVFASLATWTGILGMFVGSWLSDRVGLRKVFVWPFFFANAGMVALVAVLWGWPLYLVFLLSGFLLGCSLPQLRSIVIELKEVGPILAGSAFGGIFTVSRIGGFAIPLLMGLVMTATGIAAAGFYFIAGLALIPPVLVLFVRETGRRATTAVSG